MTLPSQSTGRSPESSDDWETASESPARQLPSLSPISVLFSMTGFIKTFYCCDLHIGGFTWKLKDAIVIIPLSASAPGCVYSNWTGVIKK